MVRIPARLEVIAQNSTHCNILQLTEGSRRQSMPGLGPRIGSGSWQLLLGAGRAPGEARFAVV